MLARKRFEIDLPDLLRGMVGCCHPLDRIAVRSEVEEQWSDDDHGFACLSVRTALDLYLSSRAFPPGSEILMSGANIPDMARVVVAHDLIPVPVDFDLLTLTPTIDAIESCRTDQSRALIFAHLFGGIVPLDSIGQYCSSHGLDLVEDCAQAYLGPEFTGHSNAQLSLFSFGPIKSATALAGAIASVRDAELRAHMRTVESQWPVANNTEYFARLMKYTGLSLLTRDLPYSLLSAGARVLNGDLDQWVGQAARSFPPDQLMNHLRRQPGGALLSLLLARQRDATAQYYRDRAALGRTLATAIGHAAEVPGHGLQRHSFWVFPILCPRPVELIRSLRAAGFDATQRATLAPLSADLPQLEAAFQRLIYLPFDRKFPAQAIERMGRIIREHAASHAPSAPGKTVKTAPAPNR